MFCPPKNLDLVHTNYTIKLRGEDSEKFNSNFLKVFLKKVLLGGGPAREKYKKLIANQLTFNFNEAEASDDQKDFCICRGAFKSGFFVACEGEDDCQYGGWLHPECTQTLAHLSKEQIDELGTWYCPSCTLKN